MVHRGVLHRSWKTIWSTPLGDLDQSIRLAEGKFSKLSPKLIEKSPAPSDYLGHAERSQAILKAWPDEKAKLLAKREAIER
jgi:hypothetical protein